MGIPSYFSFIIRNHPEIITNLEQLLKSPEFQYAPKSNLPTTQNTNGFQHLFFDANSIIYDAFHALHKEHSTAPFTDFYDSQIFFPLLTQRVIEIIEKHIHFIQPSETLFIAFDGMPPPAKIIQQKSRRFKTRHLESMVKQFRPNKSQTSSPPKTWQTNMITPGTPFMTFLSEQLKIHFKKRSIQHPIIKIQILSTSTDPGEGEHKFSITYEIIPQNPPTKSPFMDSIVT
jgi:5'-3' exonuclease